MTHNATEPDERPGGGPQPPGADCDAQLPGTDELRGVESPPRSLDAAPGWIALPVGRADAGPSIAELVQAVEAAGGVVGGEALFDPRYEPEMRRFLIRALEMEGIPVPKGGGTP